MDPQERLRMSDLQKNSWIKGTQPVPSTPLMTPDVLSSGSTEKGLQTTFDAFHKAEREGFYLQEVGNAKLAQRRRQKKSSSDTSNNSSYSSSKEASLSETRVEEYLNTISTSPPLDPLPAYSSCRVSTEPETASSSPKKYQRKVYERTRRSERIQILQFRRMEVDIDLSETKVARKRKIDEVGVNENSESPKRKVRRQVRNKRNTTGSNNRKIRGR